MTTLDPATGYTCVTCQLVFRNPDVQREHYRTDWHRYNLKRQVSELPPVTDEQFRAKVVNFKKDKEQAKEDAVKEANLLCEICNKRFSSKNAYADHLRSKKHLEVEKYGRRGPRQPRKKTTSTAAHSMAEADKVQKDVEMESDDEDVDTDSSGWHTDHGSEDEEEADTWDYDENQALPVTACLFCPQTSSTFDKNLEHMKTRHDFAIPDKQYCSDEQGMIGYLGLKVGAGRVCLYCPESKGRYQSIQAVQKHMMDKEHCRVSREPQSMLEFVDWYDYSALYDELVDAKAPFDDGWTLTLPSGAKIGHRALMRYYKQNIRGVDNQVAVQQLAVEKTNCNVKALSWIGGGGSGKMVNVGVSRGQLVQAAKDIKMMERARRRFALRTSVWHNKLFKTEGRKGDN
ncbi:unnamed protein product, partial [Mesorhabditis spiculigera]